MVILKISKQALLLLLISLLLGCKNQDGNSQVSSLTKELRQTLDDAKKKFEGLTPDSSAVKAKTSEEIEKLFRFEYRIEELKKESTREELEFKLIELGNDRWDCFHIESSTPKIRLFCKRMPRTYLRYLTHVF